MTQFNIPILFLIFNQPEKTLITFKEIAKIKPTRLYIAADGPRKNIRQDIIECKETRKKVLGMINWNCEVNKRFQKTNLGCKDAVSSSITWFLNDCKEGIIVEYDCVPSQSFFYFCKEMLNRYRNDDRIMSISGSNYQFGKTYSDGAYYYSRIPSVWGWATWNYAWKKWDGDIKNYELAEKFKMLENYFKDKKVIKFWKLKFYQIYNKIDDTWGLPWVFACFINNGLSVTPNVNLITNIGFSSKGTHAKNVKDVHACMERFQINNFKAPTVKFPILDADEYFSKDLSILPVRKKIFNSFKVFLKKILTKNTYKQLKSFYRYLNIKNN